MPASETFECDLDRLHREYRGSLPIRSAIDHFAGRERNASETKVDNLEGSLKLDGVPATRGQIIGLFRTLEDCRCGRFKIGRRTHPSRFEWSVPNAEMAKMVQAQQEPSSVLEEVSTPKPPVPARPATSSGTIEHSYRLRPDYVVALRLPVDLSAAEAEKMVLFVRSLPFA